MSATRPILTAVRDYLAAELPAYTVELFPDDPAGYRFMAPLGAVLVGYQGSKFARPDGLGLIGQQRDVTLALTVFGRGLNHDGAALDLLDALRLAITGYRPPDCEPCHLISEQFLAEEGGAWQYQLIAQTETQQVERRPADTRPKVSSLYLRQQHSITVPRPNASTAVPARSTPPTARLPLLSARLRPVRSIR